MLQYYIDSYRVVNYCLNVSILMPYGAIDIDIFTSTFIRDLNFTFALI